MSRLFGCGEREEEAFLDALAELKPIVERAAMTIDANLAEIRALRERSDKRDAEVVTRARHELTRHELSALAERLEVVPPSRAAGCHGARA